MINAVCAEVVYYQLFDFYKFVELLLTNFERLNWDCIRHFGNDYGVVGLLWLPLEREIPDVIVLAAFIEKRFIFSNM